MATSDWCKFDKENTNFARLCKLLISGGTKVLRDIFDGIHPPHELRNHLDDPAIEPILRKLRTRRALFQEQWDKLYGPSSLSVTSASFDITLLCLLLRNICHLPNPAKGWKDEPLPTSINTEDDIVRVKLFRNRLYGHISQPALSDAEFTKYWNDIETVLVRLGADKAATDDLKRQPLDQEAEQHFIQCLQEWENNEKTMIKEVEKLGEKMDEQHQELSKVRETISEIHSCLIEKQDTSSSTELTGNFSKNGSETKKRKLQENENSIPYEPSKKKLMESGANSYSEKLKTSTKQRTEIQPKGRVGSQSLFENVKTDQIFTTLTIHEGPKHLKQNETQQHLHTETRKEIKKCADLFAENQTGKDHPRSILIDGKAGIGKTLFTQKLVRDWAKDCLFDFQEQGFTYPDIKFAFLLKFRQLNLLGEKEVSLVELLNLSSTLNETTTLDVQMMEYIIEHQDHLLLVLDGYDEYKERDKIISDFHSAFPDNPKSKMPIEALVSKLVSRSILRDSVILITSRSSQAVEIAENIHFDRYVEISGFSEPHFNEYVDKYFELKPEEIRNKAVNKVKGSQHYFSFGVVPLLCYLMCVVVEWETRNQLTSDNLVIRKTLTEFYCQVINCVERNYNRIISSLFKTAASAAVIKTLGNFSRLSAKLLAKNRFSFTEEDLTNLDITEEEREYMKSSSLLSCTPVASNSPFGETTYEYSFHHYTFQEFLACRYFVSTNQIPTELTDMSCVFMSGLMDPQRNERLMEKLLQHVERQGGVLKVTILLLKCLEEYKDKEFVTQVLVKCDRRRYWGADDRIRLQGIADMECFCVALLVKTLTAASHELTTPPNELVISESSITSSGLEVLMSALTSNNCTINKLTLYDCCLDDKCCKMFVLSLEQTNITELSLNGNKISDIGAACIAEHSKKLTALRLSSNRITDIGVASILHCRKLTELDLGSNNITDEGVACFDNHYNNLTKLYLGRNDITDKGVYRVAEHLENLTKLDLCLNNITDTGVEYIAMYCSKLTKLDLSSNNITDTGADCIAKHCSKLTKLNLSSNNITDTGADCIAKHCSKLTKLKLTGNNITDIGVDYIVKRCNNLRLLSL